MAAKKTAPAATPEAQAEKPCLCGAYELEIGSDAETMQYADTGCAASTTRDFAPGHDAKLKALLIRAGVEDLSVRINKGGVVHVTTAEDAAAAFPFAYMVTNGIKNGKEKAAAQAARKADRAARKEAAATKAPRARKAKVTEATIKIGRWTYEAKIDASSNATYTTSGGQTKTAPKGKYTLV